MAGPLRTGIGLVGPSCNTHQAYSARSASNGEIKLARIAGIKDATSAENPSVRTASKITTGLYGFIP